MKLIEKLAKDHMMTVINQDPTGQPSDGDIKRACQAGFRKARGMLLSHFAHAAVPVLGRDDKMHMALIDIDFVDLKSFGESEVE